MVINNIGKWLYRVFYVQTVTRQCFCFPNSQWGVTAHDIKYFKGNLTAVLSIQILQRKSVRIVTIPNSCSSEYSLGKCDGVPLQSTNK